jgi:hypothetical protein
MKPIAKATTKAWFMLKVLLIILLFISCGSRELSSSRCYTKEEALNWYNNFGKKLENMFNRKLVLKINEV